MSEAITKACPVCTHLHVQHCTLCSGTGGVPDIEATQRAQLDAQRILIERFESALRGKESENAELRGELHALRGIDYAKSSSPATYRCAECHVGGVKLWRRPHSITQFLCRDCAGSAEKVDVSHMSAEGRIMSMFGHTDTIGAMLPAVPTPDGRDVWGYTSVPQDACEWWRGLPSRRDADMTLRAEVARLKEELSDTKSTLVYIKSRLDCRIASDDHARASVARLTAEVERLSQREPTQQECDAAEGKPDSEGNTWPDGEVFLGTTCRRCIDCGRWAFGGPTRCLYCAGKYDATVTGQMYLDDLRATKAEVERLSSRLKSAEEVVTQARQLVAYSWEDRLDDSRVSDDAKQDARELEIAVWHYDQRIKTKGTAT